MEVPPHTFEIVILTLMAVLVAMWVWLLLRRPCRAPQRGAKKHLAHAAAAPTPEPLPRVNPVHVPSTSYVVNTNPAQAGKGLDGGETASYQYSKAGNARVSTAYTTGFDRFKSAPGTPATNWDAPTPARQGINGKSRAEVLQLVRQSALHGVNRVKLSSASHVDKARRRQTGLHAGMYALLNRLDDEQKNLKLLNIDCERALAGSGRLPAHHPCHEFTAAGRKITAETNRAYMATGRVALGPRAMAL